MLSFIIAIFVFVESSLHNNFIKFPSIGDDDLLCLGFLIMEYTEEKWEDIKLYEGIYQVSNIGNIRSLPRIVRSGHTGYVCKGGIILKSIINKKGYKRIVLRKEKNKTNFFVHILVAKTFIENPFSLPQVNHINGIKTDNRAKNLEWCTPSQNILHAVKLGLIKSAKGSLNGMSKLTKKQVLDIRDENCFLSNRDMANLYKVNIKTIRNVLNRKTWSDD